MCEISKQMEQSVTYMGTLVLRKFSVILKPF